ncbi:MAG TPA: hypothetical protein VFK03_02510 [Candidatus Saccharimonadales bacterium]|nr:hypothetical protein [Candidatus Saccharimonadales bacterium]
MMATIVASALVFTVLPAAVNAAPNGHGQGFDQNGYNDNARVFVGDCLDWYTGKYGGTEAQAQNYCGDYANDQLVMKWNKAWDECNATTDQDDASVCAGAWLTNHWNGHVPGGSGEVWQYKYVWVGSEGENSPYWRDGGESIWGNYEVVMSQGVAGGEHSVLTHATPNGLGKN